jgi:hypothetical protein
MVPNPNCMLGVVKGWVGGNLQDCLGRGVGRGARVGLRCLCVGRNPSPGKMPVLLVNKFAGRRCNFDVF